MIMQDVNHQLFSESVRDKVMLSMTDKSLTDGQKAGKADEILKSLDLFEYATLTLWLFRKVRSRGRLSLQVSH